MRRTKLALRASLSTLCAAAVVIGVGSQAAGASTAGRSTLAGSAPPAAATTNAAGAVSTSSQENFDVVLNLRDRSGAEALVQAISSPGSASFRHYVTRAAWEARFSPTSDQVNQVKAWLRSEGFKVGSVSKDRITVAASGTAAQVESAFGTGLANYKVAGHTLQEATGNLSVPSSLAGVVAGTLGINQTLATADAASEPGLASSATGAAASPNGKFPPAPAAFLPAGPCSPYYGADTTTTNPPYGNGFPNTVPDVVCGYKPPQYRSAYGITSAATGKGVTVAIIDAYGSSTIASDATTYFNNNDPSNPFSNAKFTQIDATPFDDYSACAPSSWLVEQAIDVEAVHSTAPNAHILFYGAQDCENGLFTAEQNVIDNGLANVVTNSWADTGGDLLDDAATKTAYDDLFMLADSTGMTIQFSTGDDGDNFYVFGFSAANYPSESPFITGVGGTSLEIGSAGQRVSELGWQTGRSILCTSNIESIGICSSSQLNTWLPESPDGGSGGYTSYYYTQPFYQAGVVPLALSERNFTAPARVIPDISADADPGTGFLLGLHQNVSVGKSTVDEYTQTRYGGTSLASPLLAGMVADADQVASVPVGFINPVIYRLDVNRPSTIYDVQPPSSPTGNFRRDFAGANGENFPTTGYFKTFRDLYFQGTETYCDATGNCASRPDPLSTAPGYDSMTGLGSPGTGFINALAGS